MIGNEQKLNVYIHRQHIATMTLEQDQLVLRYNATWQQVGFALSPHLPLQQETPPINVQRFFRNLLPEGMIFEELARQLLLSKFNTFGLIQALGMDLSGALIIQTSNQSIPDIAHFRLITPEELT